MSGKSKDDHFIMELDRKAINEIYELMNEVQVKNEYVQLNYEDYFIVRVLEAYKLYLNNRGMEADYKVVLSERE
jgi:hypothetical protein